MPHTNPLLRLFIPFLLGIVWAMFSVPIQVSSPIFFILIGFTVIFLGSQKYLPAYKLKWLTGIWLFAAMLFFGYYLTMNKIGSYRANHFETTPYIEAFKATVVEQPVEKNKTIKAVLQIDAIKDSARWIEKQGKIIVYIEKTERSFLLKTGSSIVLKGFPKKVVNAGNPGEFDYAGYLARKGIFHQLYLPNTSWIPVSAPSQFSLQSAAERVREKLLNNMKGNGIQGEDFDVASAILLGYDDLIDPETRKAYSGTGAMHILSVSGLHVGIIYTILSYLLAFMVKKKNGPILKALLLIAIIWLYAFITGLAPATVRSAAMFTFVSVGSVFGRKTPMYNTLAASALFILIVNPLLIADIGFQLSYTAVAGIVAIQPGLSMLLPLKNKIAVYFRDLVTVSIAAQIATLPITIFYFNQFPNYFLITNLLIIPWSFLVMVVGMVFVVISPVHGLAYYFGKLLSYLVFIMNWAIKSIESIPYSVTYGIMVNHFEMALLSLLILFMIMFFYSKLKTTLFASLITACLLFLSILYGMNTQGKQQNLIFCNYPKINCLLLINGNSMKLVADSLPNTEKINDLIQEFGIKKTEIVLLDKNAPLSKRFIWFNQKKIVFFDEALSRLNPSKKFDADIIVLAVQNHAVQKPFSTHYNAPLYLIGPSLSAAKTKQWLQGLPTQNCIDIKKSGCFYLFPN